MIYPQFATHNAHSIASVLELAPAGANYEFQRLHGMGRLLYAEAARQVANFPRVRVYAPVGEHKDLLAYLVRRLLENGANTSFVNRFMDEQVPVAEIVRDPISELERLESYAHPRLPLPAALYADRRNSRGIDLGDPPEVEALREEIWRARLRNPRPPKRRRAAAPSSRRIAAGGTHPVTNPADRREQVGSTRDATPEEIARPSMPPRRLSRRGTTAAARRARECLEKASDLLEAGRAEFHPLLVREAGKTISDAIAEVREAVDFCRYYAVQARSNLPRPRAWKAPPANQRVVAAWPRRVRLHQSLEFSLGDFRRTGHRGAGGRQCRGGKARGAYAVDRRALREDAARGGRSAAGLASDACTGAHVRGDRLRSCGAWPAWQ